MKYIVFFFYFLLLDGMIKIIRIRSYIFKVNSVCYFKMRIFNYFKFILFIFIYNFR